MHAFLFPGQGSQHVGMGGARFDTPRFREVEPELDDVLGFSVRRTCLAGPEAVLKDTRRTQPCVFIVNALCHDEAVALHGSPDLAIGHSLGEYNALHAAGAFDLMTGVRLVMWRAELMASAAAGGMLAVLRVTSDRVAAILGRDGLTSIDVANYNSPRQTVLAGPLPDLERARASLESDGASCLPLPVSAPFHSRYMRSAAARLSAFLDTIGFAPLRIDVVSTVSAALYPRANPWAVRGLLAEQLVRPVRWGPCITLARSMGVTRFREVGPGTVLTRLVEQIEQPSSL